MNNTERGRARSQSGGEESAPLLRVRNADVTVDGRAILSNIDLTVQGEDLIFLLGPNGAGKSSLLRLLLGRLTPERGSVDLAGRSLSRLSGRERAAFLAYLPQRSAITEAMVVRDLVTAARYRFIESNAASITAALHALRRVGAEALQGRIWTTLSGGEQQRVSLAVVLAQDAEILLFDEPASHLDPAFQIEMYRQIGQLSRSGRTILCVTHDINLIGRAAAEAQKNPRIVGLQEGRESFSTLFDSPELSQHLSALFNLKARRLPNLNPATFVFDPPESSQG